MGKKMGMRAVLTRLLGIAAVACALTAVPATAEAETVTMPDGARAEVLSLESDSVTPITISEPGSYVLKTDEDEMTPIMGYTIDVPNASRINPVRIYIDGTVYVNRYENSRVYKQKWLFNIKQASNVEFVGVNDPCIRFKDKDARFQAASGFLTDRYYDGGYKNATSDISVSLKVGDNSENFILSYDHEIDQAVPAISLGNTRGKLTADFSKLRIRDYVGKSGNSIGYVSPKSILEYAVPVRLFRSSFSNEGRGNTNALNATFTDCKFYDTSGDYNGAVSIVGNPNDANATSKLVATFKNCRFSGSTDVGIRQTNKSYTSVDETTEFADVQETGKCAVAGVMGVTNATVNLDDCMMDDSMHSTRSSSADCTLTVDALNIGCSARCNMNNSVIMRYAARGNTCLVYDAGTLALDGSPTIASYWKNSHAGDRDYGDKYTEADIATGTAKSLYIPKKKANSSVPALNIASSLSALAGVTYGNVWISVEEMADNPSSLSRVLGTCESSKIRGIVPDGSSENDDNSDTYEIVNDDGKLTFRKTIHTHKWKVAVDGLGVRATCVGPFHNSDCPYGTASDGTSNGSLLATYKLKMRDTKASTQTSGLTYDGSPAQLSMSKEDQNELSQMGVTAGDPTWYSCKTAEDAEAFKNGTKLESAPTDAGNYYVVVTFKTSPDSSNAGSTLEAKKAFKIEARQIKGKAFKFTLKDGGKGAGRYAYDTKEHTPVVESAMYTNDAKNEMSLVEGKDFELSGTSESDLKQTEPGKYTCMVIGKGNFMTETAPELTWEIVDVGRFDIEAAGYKGVYDGKEHGITVTVKNAPADMKIEYRLSDGDWGTENPLFENALTRTVYYRVTASDYLTVTGKEKIEISKADQGAPTDLAGSDWATCSSKDGSISGVTKAMEYRRGTNGKYAEVKADGTLEGLTSGTYYVRYAADHNHNESPDCEVTIKRGSHAVADNAKWKQGEPGWHFKSCKYCGEVAERGSCRWKYDIITPATSESDGTRQKVCRICGGKDFYTGVESYTYTDTYPPVIYDIYDGESHCGVVSFEVYDDRDETVTVTDNGAELKAGKDGMFTIKAAAGDNGAEHVIVATDKAGNKETKTIKMYAEHNYSWTIDKEPTVSEPGSKHGTCSRCGQESGAVEIPAMTVKGYSGEYDGKAHSVDASGLPKGAEVEYRMDANEAWSKDAPAITNVGTQEVMFRVTVDDATVEGTATLEVTPCAVTVAAKDASKVYGETDPALGYEIAKGSLVEGESLNGITVTRETGEDVREGGYVLNVAVAAGANPNYSIKTEPGTFTITAKTLGISWSDREFTYDGESHVATATPTGVVGSDDVAFKVEGAAKKAGKHTATVTGITGDAAGNYALPKDGLTCEFTIKKAPQGAPKTQSADESISGKHDGKITGVDASMEWCAKGAANYTAVPAGITELTGLAPDTYLVRYAATDNHDASADVEVTVAAGRKLKVSLPAKQEGYTLTASAAELGWHQELTLKFGLADGYYQKVDGFAVKVNGEPVALAEDGTVTVVGIEEDAAVTVEGVAKHEAVKDAPWLSDADGHWHECTCGDKIDETEHTFKTVIDRKPTASESGSKHQECTVCGYKSASEDIPAASVGGYSGEYDGQWHGPDTTNVPDGLMVSYSYDNGESWTTGEPGRKDVGTEEFIYKMTIDGAVVEGKAAIEIAPREVTLKATDASKVYGEADPQLDYTVPAGELVEGESLDGISVAREKGDTVKDGGYAITIAQEKGSNSNYDITLEPGTFTITQRPLRVTWGTTDFVYDGKAHAPAAALGNVLKGDEVEATVEGAQTEANREGELYSAIVTGLKGTAAGNYALPAEGLSHAFTIRCAPQDAPKVQAEAEGISGRHDGKITGVDAAMEWRAKDATAYQPVTGDTKELTGLAPGTYLVRYQAKANHDASPDTEVTVAAGRKLTVTVPTQQVGYTLTTTASELDWHGSATLAMSIDGRYFADKKAYVVKVDGKKVDLPADGTYVIKDAESDVNVTVEGVLRHEPDGTGWQSDGTDHWHVCRCGDVIDKAAHDFEWVTDTPATVEAEGTRHQECKVCGARGADGKIDILAPEIVEGADQTLTKAPEVPVDSDLTVRSNAPLRLFKRVLVDGKEVADTYYTLKEGSTIVALKAAYLATLSTGEHRLSIESESGTAETTFTIAEQRKPAGDSGGAATGGNGGTAKPSAPKGDAEKGAGTKTATGKAAKATMPTVGDGTFAAVAAVLAAGIASIVAALVVRRR